MPKTVSQYRKRGRPQSLATTAAASADCANLPAAAATVEENVDAEIEMTDSEEETDEEFSAQDANQEHLNIADCIQNAQLERVLASTRAKYVAQLRQMARWAQSTEQFKHCVSHDEMLTPLNADCMIGYTQYLKNYKVIWRYHEVPGTLKHLAVKTISAFFAAAKDSYAYHGKTCPEEVLVYFSNFIRGYSLFIAAQKDKGMHPDRTNSIGFTFSVYERICRKGSEYIQSGTGSCVSAWKQVWLFWVFLLRRL